jgi:hypothetical protein
MRLAERNEVFSISVTAVYPCHLALFVLASTNLCHARALFATQEEGLSVQPGGPRRCRPLFPEGRAGVRSPSPVLHKLAHSHAREDGEVASDTTAVAKLAHVRRQDWTRVSLLMRAGRLAALLVRAD